MTATQELARDFVAMLQRGEHEQAAAKYNAGDIVSVEAMPGPMQICRGTEELLRKGEWWASSHDIHEFTAEGPYMNGEQFAVRFFVDVTVKETGERRSMPEIGLYTVEGGKIVEERFFY